MPYMALNLLAKYSVLHPELHGTAICPTAGFFLECQPVYLTSKIRELLLEVNNKKNAERNSKQNKMSKVAPKSSPYSPNVNPSQVCMMAFSPTEFTTELNGDVPWVKLVAEMRLGCKKVAYGFLPMRFSK